LEDKIYNLELVVKCIEKELKFEKNFKKNSKNYKSIIFKENINRFKNKKNTISL